MLKLIFPQKNGKIDIRESREKAEEIIKKFEIQYGEEIFKDERNNKLKKFLSRTSGQYISPSLMKSYSNCPANVIFNTFQDRSTSSAAGIGTIFHSIMESFYNEEPCNRTEDTLNEIFLVNTDKPDISEYTKNNVLFYLNNYKNMKDYLNPDITTMKAAMLEDRKSYTEYFIKASDVATIGNYRIPKMIYSVLDRVDFIDNQIFILDYKVGKTIDPIMFGIDGYLPQMVFYKWAIFQEFGISVKDAIIVAPGQKEHIILKDAESIKIQSMIVDKIDQHCKDLDNYNETRIYEERKMSYCQGCMIKDRCCICGNGSPIIEIEIKEEDYVPQS